MPRRDDQGESDESRESVVVSAVQRGAVAEVRRDVAALDRRADRIEIRIDKVEERVDVASEHVDTLRERHARLEGQVSHLTEAYQRAASVATAQVMTDLEIRKSDALAQIKDRGLERKHGRAIRRELVFKAVTIAMGLWALLYSMLQSRC